MKTSIKIPKGRFNRLQVGIITVTLTAVFMGCYYFFSPTVYDLLANVPAPSEQSQKADTLFEKADQLASNGHYEEGVKILDDGLAKAQTDVDKSELYLKKSSLASNASRLEDAYAHAKKAEVLHPTRLSAILVAQSAEELENLATALTYYKLVVERTTESQRNLASYDSYYEAKVKELSK